MKDLVCLHAGTSGPSTWRRFIPDFEALGYRVHCPTLLGHGQAPRRRAYFLDDFRDQVRRELERLDRVTLVGNSLGAFVATALAVREPAARRDRGSLPPATGLVVRPARCHRTDAAAGRRTEESPRSDPLPPRRRPDALSNDQDDRGRAPDPQPRPGPLARRGRQVPCVQASLNF
ncbi:alpha/beta fold hydrolase [Kribbella sp. HUAS MG21]|uniref:alpha/beta fold hydrolase n=1 Tax=Kribbella sp. HUAS MG21 TaxID=3160966 RepID=UPI0033059656